MALSVGATLFGQTPRETQPPTHPPSATVATTPSVTTTLTAQDVGAFLDGILTQQLARGDIAGAVVAVVKDGTVLFERGYGYADVKARRPVTAQATLFRPGSISKTFTWTAVMQLVELGHLDLDHDINEYLDFKIPAPFGRPVTLRNLMTHTPGWEEVVKELFVADSAALYPMERYVKKRLPQQVFAPGTTPAYSNYGATLAGYIVQRVSGMPFEEYIEKNIFTPLGMTHSSFRQPLPPALRPMMSQGYARASDSAKTYEYVETGPAGSLATTADDMTHFMIAHLQDGEYGGARILKAETAQRMHSRTLELAPGMNGMAHGFYEESRNGVRIIGHAGDTQWFHSDMHLVPNERLGFFVSYNSAGNGNGGGRTDLWWAFLDRYFPYTPSPVKPIANASTPLRSLAGNYWPSRRSVTTLFAFTSMDQPSVIVNRDSTISVDVFKDFAGNARRFRQVAPLVFQEEHGQERLVFKKDANGVMTIVTGFPVIVLQRVPGWRGATLMQLMLAVAILIPIIALVMWPVAAMARVHYKRPLAMSPRLRRARLLTYLGLAAILVFVIAGVSWATAVQGNIALVSSRYDWLVRMLQCLAVLGILGAVAAVRYAWLSWRDRSIWEWSKFWNGLVALACVCFAWLVVTWKIVVLHLNY